MSRMDGDGRRSALSDAKRALLMKRVQQRPAAAAATTIRPRPAGAEAPLSFAQQRLWFLDQLDAGSAQYNETSVVRLRGALDAETVARALTEVSRRHEALRTVFPAVDGVPVQVVSPAAPVSLPSEDLSGRSSGEQEAEVRRYAREQAAAPFDLAAGPVFRAKLLRLGSEEHALVLTIHHIVMDGWSMGLLFREISMLCSSFARGEPSPLAELPVQYADYAVWQREYLSGETLERQLAYWRGRLEGAPALLELPTDRPRPPVQSFRGARVRAMFAPELLQGLEALGRSESATVFMTLLAAFQLLLSRYSGQEDVVVGTPVAGRDRPELEELIGLFLNTLVLRTSVAGDPTFRELLRRVRETTLGAYVHQDLPFEKLVEVLQPERSLAYNPLFQVMLTLQSAPTRNAAATAAPTGGVSLSQGKLHGGTAQFDLELNAETGPDGLFVVLEYSTDLFDAPTMQRMLGHLREVLETAAADPDRPVSRFGLLTEGERRQVVEEWNDTAVRFPDAGLDELFQARVRLAPDAPALADAGESLSYAELSRRAGHAAARLRAAGVGTDSLVAVLGERNAALWTAVLGVLRAGGAYVPLDPAHPPARIGGILRGSGSRVLLASRALEPLVESALQGVEPAARPGVLRLEELWAEDAPDPVPAVAHRPDGRALAYVIYTSGSTGVPKGAMVEHAGMLNHLHAKVADLRMGPDDRVAQTASQCFDISVWQLLSPLAAGARVHVFDDDVVHDPVRLLERVEELGITVLEVVPSMLRAMLDAVEGGDVRPGLERLRWLLVTGEALPPELCRRSLELFPHVPLLNAYGPTECSDDVTHHRVDAPPPGEHVRVPIGRAIANTRLYVLDGALNPVPVGVAGELYVGGAGVGRGYLGDPERTARAFVPDPFGREPGARLYRTGDLARRLPGGELDFLGRVDHQVKVRGFRIELGEIESALLRHPAVQECAVLAREAAGSTRLVAYLAGPDAAALPVAELRAHLKELLPEYMVPAAFVALDRLPLNANGKLDRAALPEPDADLRGRDADYAAPRTPAEETLAAVWKEVLRVERVGIHDNFFELGGDSILSIQVIARARKAGVQVTPRQVFQHQTVAALAAVAGTAAAVENQQGPVLGRVELTPAQYELLAREPADPHHYNLSVLLEVRRALEPGVLEGAVGHLLAHHDALRLRFRRVQGGWEQESAAPGGAVPFRAVDLSHLEGEAQRAALEAECAWTQGSLDLEHGPLLRAVHFDLGAGRPGRLLVVAHHLAVDGVSWRILLEDLETACERLARGETVDLGPKTTSYQRWAERLRAFAGSPELLSEVEHWAAVGAARPPRLPRDGAGAATVDSIRTVSAWLEADDTEALLTEVPAAYRTQVNDALLAALVEAFHGWTGERRLLIHLEGHGREDLFEEVDLSRTVGWFTSTYPVALERVDGGPGEVLKETKERLRAIPRRGIGFGTLRWLSGDAAVRGRLAALPTPEVVFNYLGQFGGPSAPGESLFAGARERRGPEQSPRQEWPHLLEVNASVSGGRLGVHFGYAEGVHHAPTVRRLADAYVEALRKLVEHCRTPEAGGYTPSDFPEAALSQEDLDAVLAELSES